LLLAPNVLKALSMTGVRNPQELDVWKLSDELRVRVRAILARPGFAQHANLHEQLEKSSEGPCANIAEGFSRYLPDDNARFVRTAAGSLSETIEHLSRARANGLITTQEMEDLHVLARRARGAASAFARYLQSSEAPHVPPRRRRRTAGQNQNRNPEPREP